MGRILRLAILVSGQGTTLEGLAEEIDEGRLPASIVLVVSDRPNVPAIDRANRHGYPVLVLPRNAGTDPEWSDRLTKELDARRAELVLLAGFRSIVPGDWVRRWEGRVINVHPSLLPKYGGRGFYGSRVHKAVLASRDPETGATVHLVTAEVDQGAILGQERINVDPGDTAESLRERLRPVERTLLVQAIRRFADGTWPLPYRGPDDPPTASGERRTIP